MQKLIKVLVSTAVVLGLLALTLPGCAGLFSPAPPASPVPTQTPPQMAPLAPVILVKGVTSPPAPIASPPSPPDIPAESDPLQAMTSPGPPPATALVATPLMPVSSPVGLLLRTANAAAVPCPCHIEHVVLISIDGLRPDAWEQADTPTLDALRARGTYSPAARSVLPSVTLVNYASMLSGMGPNKHGITWNDNRPDRAKVRGPTVFSVAHAAGLSTAMVVGKPKLEQLVLAGSVDIYDYAGFIDAQVVKRAIAVIQANRPNLLFIHLPDVDSAGHAAGWMSPVQLMVVSRTDALIEEIVTALEAGEYLDRTLLIITSDHGGSGQSHGSDSVENTTVPWLAVGPGVPTGAVVDRKIEVYDTAATILYAFGLPIPEIWDGQPVLEIFSQARE